MGLDVADEIYIMKAYEGKPKQGKRTMNENLKQFKDGWNQIWSIKLSKRDQAAIDRLGRLIKRFLEICQS